jgi:anthranilate phosphoribosyltransferase
MLMGLRVQGESAETVAAVARALRRAMVPLSADRPDDIVDTCGTGGGAVSTFNISTAAALVAAGAGARVAKHGNRSFTSRSGSADVLEALGVPIDRSAADAERALAACGIAFMFAPLMQPAMRHVGPVRRELAIPTVMNVVGPLANPARAGRQVLGVAEAHRVPLLAAALAALGSVHALVVHGAPGMDEISPLGPTRVVEVRRSEGASRVVAEWTIDPSDHGFHDVAERDIAGGSPDENAAIIEAVLAGGGAAGRARGRGAQRGRGAVRGRDRARLRGRGATRTRGDRLRSRSRRARTPAGGLPRVSAVAREAGRCADAHRPASPSRAPRPCRPAVRRSVPLRTAPYRSVAPQHADDHALDADVVLVHVDRLHRVVRRLQADAAVALAKNFFTVAALPCIIAMTISPLSAERRSLTMTKSPSPMWASTIEFPRTFSTKWLPDLRRKLSGTGSVSPAPSPRSARRRRRCRAAAARPRENASVEGSRSRGSRCSCA